MLCNKACIICLVQDDNTKQIEEIISNNTNDDTTTIQVKLKECVPEVEWFCDSFICYNCLDKLKLVCAFRQLCIQSYSTRSKSLTTTNQRIINAIINDGVGSSNNNNINNNSSPAQTTTTTSSLSDDDNYVTKNNETTTTATYYNCYHCCKRFRLKTRLVKHIQNEHTAGDVAGGSVTAAVITPPPQQQINTCDLCGSQFTNKYLLKRHVRNVHATEKKYKCDLCERCFASPVYLTAHKRYHSGDRTHICSFCGKGYITASDRYHHEKIHANKRAYRCDRCPKAFNTSSDLHKHNICVHVDRAQWKYACTLCERRFPLKTNLDTHTKTHTGERNFVCHLCERRCINRSVLRRHIISHSNVRAFKCDLCCNDYKYRKSLDLHLMKVHGMGDQVLLMPPAHTVKTKVKNYFCSLCPKSFFANNKLQKHIRSSHTGERPFPCPVCAKAFVDKSYVKQHIKTMHADTLGTMTTAS